jgi:oligopeptide transport system substrate-binding protein
MQLSALKLQLLLIPGLFLVACGGGESNVVQGNREGILHFGNGTEPQEPDPHVVTGNRAVLPAL